MSSLKKVSTGGGYENVAWVTARGVGRAESAF